MFCLAEAGKHIIVEKPMALTVEAADDIINACIKNKVKVEVISQLRFSPAVRKLKKAVDDGLLGRIVNGDIYMKYYCSKEYYGNSGWRGTWSMDGVGALMNQGIHGVDLMRYISWRSRKYSVFSIQYAVVNIQNLYSLKKSF